MSTTRFFHQLHEGGDVLVGPLSDEPPPSPVGEDDLVAAIASTEVAWRAELAMEPPPLVMPAAVWGVKLMYQACQFLVHREVEPARVAATLAAPCPAPVSDAVSYSADIGLRVLPDVLTLARAASPTDPLVVALQELATRWPLSSVGTSVAQADDISPFIEHPSLRRLYADRIIERGDATRLSDVRAAEAVREALGGYPEIAPRQLASALSKMGEK